MRRFEILIRPSVRTENHPISPEFASKTLKAISVLSDVGREKRKHFLGPSREYVADKPAEALKTQHDGPLLITERQTSAHSL